MNNLYYLSHGGPGSGRYPLGSGDRPYQKFEGSRKRSSGISGYIKSKKARKQKFEEEKKKREEEKEQKIFEAEKDRILKKGTATEVLKYKDQLTIDELRKAENRLQLENKLQQYSTKEVQTALNHLKKLQSYTNVGSALAKDGIELWNSFAAIYNTTSAGKASPLKSIKNK